MFVRGGSSEVVSQAGRGARSGLACKHAHAALPRRIDCHYYYRSLHSKLDS